MNGDAEKKMEIFVRASFSNFIAWLRSFVEDLDMGKVSYAGREYIVEATYHTPESYEEDNLPGPEFIQPTLTFIGSMAYSSDFGGVLAVIEIRQLDNGRLQIFFNNFSSIKSHHTHMENVFNLIYNEILRFWPITPAKATDIIEDARPQKPQGPERPPKEAPRDAWFQYYDDCKKNGMKYTLEDLAGDLHLSPGYVRTLHLNYTLRQTKS
jgi:AraC-like DNA-binding protein